MRQIETPLRPQLFSSGLVTICKVVDTAEKGDKPHYTARKLFDLPYQDRKLGNERYYAPSQADSKVSKVIRVPRVSGIQPAGDLAVLAGDSRQYRVQKVSELTLTNPESMELTLEISKNTYTLEGG